MNLYGSASSFWGGFSSKKEKNNYTGNLAVNSNYASLSNRNQSGGIRALTGLIDPKEGDPIIITNNDELANPGDGDPIIIVDGDITSGSWIFLLFAIILILYKRL